MAVLSTNLGFPRMGPRRELKRTLESYWAGEITVEGLQQAVAGLRERRWRLHADLGIDHIPSGDFSLYDHVLDTAVLVGAVPERYLGTDVSDLDRYFAMARGGSLGTRNVTALAMTKWFDTNYHYLVPELVRGQRFSLSSTKPLDELRQAAGIGIATRPVLLGPVSFLMLAKRAGSKSTCSGGAGAQRSGARASNLDLLPALCDVYADLLGQLLTAGASWVQVDEPVLALDLDAEHHHSFRHAYERLAQAAPGLRLMLTTYFGGLRSNLPLALDLPVAALHLDAVTEPAQLDAAIESAPERLALSIGIVDGRNVWRTDLEAALSRLEPACKRLGAGRIMVGPSCSLLHLPYDLDLEPSLDVEVRTWLAFATQRLHEVTVLARALNEGREAVRGELRASREACAARAASRRVHNPAVQSRVSANDPALERRSSPYPLRRAAQARHLRLPLLPTTTIGSFPQTKEVRSLRGRQRRATIDATSYEHAIRQHIAETIAFQEEVGLDVLVHGEPERNDMVEYFGELLEGFAVTENGWVQSYGSRCVKPPILYGDVSRARPMTVPWISYAQSRTAKPVKGMLTGPVTILHWSFVRNDRPLAHIARQLAYSIRDEVLELEDAGIGMIQIDEPALREGLPLHISDRGEYLAWAESAFRIASSGVRDETQIHTHMCYSEFHDIIDSVAAFDADVISIEASRSHMELLRAFAEYEYPNEVGPGIWDIHSPRVPETSEMVELLELALEVLPAERLWVNPDCGLKTRRWEEVRPAVAHMVEAASTVRQRLRTG